MALAATEMRERVTTGVRGRSRMNLAATETRERVTTGVRGRSRMALAAPPQLPLPA